LPSELGAKPIQAVAEAGVDYVDLSFTDVDISYLNPLAMHSGSTILHDCGLAPGLPNLIVGRELKKHGTLKSVNIAVGGVAKDPTNAYGYVSTWSLADLWQEYTRTARFIKDGKVRTEHPLYTPVLPVSIMGRRMEQFYSDGLRSLVKLGSKINNMTEYTLRWPGHMELVHQLVDSGRGFYEFIETFERECSKGEDIVLMRITCDGITYDLEVEGTDELTAMAQTTAYSCAAFAEVLLQDQFSERGVHPPEDVGKSKHAFDSVIDYLEDEGIVFDILEEGTIVG
jgi:saccharopine dehydrogenase-like NADP-dependent oxidoreductase